MNLQEGLYVRTTNGRIAKIESIIGDYIFLDINHNIHDKQKIKSVSNDLIDLIEPGDYVNGFKVLEIVKGFKVLVDKLEPNTRDGNYYLKQFTNNEIKSVVTKEVFKANEYRVEAN